jgi:signal transduction histidine kinase
MAPTQDGDSRGPAGSPTRQLPSYAYILSLSVVGGIALATFAFHFWNLSTSTGSAIEVAIGVLPPLGLSLALFGVVVWIHANRYEELAISIGRWCLAGTLLLVGVSLHSMFFQQANGGVVADPTFAIANHATVGALIGAVLGLYDGQRRTSTAELKAERERARRLTDRLSVLNRVLRHDIRNAVNVIQGNTQLVRSGSREIDTLVDTIDRKADELEALSERARNLEELLERDTLEPHPVELGATLQAKAHRLENEYPDLTIQTDIPRDVTVRAVDLLDEALDELLENAIEHNDAEQPSVSVTVDAAGPDQVRIRIEDNGPGIPESERRAIRRGRETELAHASGLGLWFVRWVMELSDGELAIHDGETGGTVVEMTLPDASA